MGREVRVAAGQIGALRGQVAHNLERCLTTLRDAADQGVELLVLPECVLSGYVFNDPASARLAAVPVDGPEIAELAKICSGLGIHAVIGFLEHDRRGGRIYNSAVLVGPGGVLGRYRKAHLPHLGVDRFASRGDDPGPVVVDTTLGRVGLAICYDLRFPESARTLALAGADVIAQPSNWPPPARVLPELFTRVRACENRVFLVVADRGDDEGGVEFIGRSQVIDPGGGVLAEAGRGEALLIADVDLARARQKSIVITPGVYEVSLFRDRRPELYGVLTERAEPTEGRATCADQG